MAVAYGYPDTLKFTGFVKRINAFSVTYEMAVMNLVILY